MKLIAGVAIGLVLAALPLTLRAHAQLLVATPANDAAPTLAPGSYTLSYRVLSDDSHIVSGSIKFRIREP